MASVSPFFSSSRSLLPGLLSRNFTNFGSRETKSGSEGEVCAQGPLHLWHSLRRQNNESVDPPYSFILERSNRQNEWTKVLIPQ